MLPPWPSTKPKRSGRQKKALLKQDVVETTIKGVGIVSKEEAEAIQEPVVQEILQDADSIAFKPNEGPQTIFLASSEREVLLGGGKGSGKTYILMVDPLRYCGCPNTRALIMRRTIPDVRDIIFKARYLYPKAYPGVVYKDNDKMFVFPSGARIEFGFAETSSDLARYQGQNYTYVGVDEIADFPFAEDLLTYIRANIRTVDPVNAPPMLRLTANPGAVSSSYIRKEFVERAPFGETFWIKANIFDMRIKKQKTIQISRKYIHSTIFDNKHLMKDDSYLATLASLPETKRKQWLEGNWYVSESAAFPEFDQNVHVVPPFEIPREWKRVKGQDWGFSSAGAVYWGTVTPSGQLIIYREFAFNTELPKKDAMKIAQEGRALEIGEPRSLGIIDTSAFQQRGTLGQSIGEIMQTQWPSWIPSSRAKIGNASSRQHRKNLVHTHLAIDPTTGEPRMVIFPQCRRLIEALSGIPVDKSNPEVVDTDSPLDHYYDALSYLLQGRPAQLRSWSDPFARKTEQPYRVNDNVFGY